MKRFNKNEIQIFVPTSFLGIFSFQNNPKDLDLSYKTDLELWDCLRRLKLGLFKKIKTHIIAKSKYSIYSFSVARATFINFIKTGHLTNPSLELERETSGPVFKAKDSYLRGHGSGSSLGHDSPCVLILAGILMAISS